MTKKQNYYFQKAFITVEIPDLQQAIYQTRVCPEQLGTSLLQNTAYPRFLRAQKVTMKYAPVLYINDTRLPESNIDCFGLKHNGLDS
jgi:hypothetical protein